MEAEGLVPRARQERMGLTRRVQNGEQSHHNKP